MSENKQERRQIKQDYKINKKESNTFEQEKIQQIGGTRFGGKHIPVHTALLTIS